MHQNSETLASSRSSILFVDDEPLAQKYFKSSLSSIANVVTAGSASEACSILDKSAQAFSLIVSDARMPHGSGVELLAEARTRWPSTVRILTSAYTDIECLQSAINDAAIYRFVPKPWDLDQLQQAVCDGLTSTAPNELQTPCPPDDVDLDRISQLSLSLLSPLRDLEVEAARLVALSGKSTTITALYGPRASRAWSEKLSSAEFTAAAAQIQSGAAVCLALAEAIALATERGGYRRLQ